MRSILLEVGPTGCQVWRDGWQRVWWDAPQPPASIRRSLVSLFGLSPEQAANLVRLAMGRRDGRAWIRIWANRAEYSTTGGRLKRRRGW